MEQQLQDIGLSELQAKTYLYLLASPTGQKPAAIAKKLGITRTNCYKVLDQLAEHDLVRRSETNKTYTFFAEDPIALTTFVSRARNETIALEKHVKSAMGALEERYKKHAGHADVTASHGKTAILQAFNRQVKQSSELYFIKSRADNPFMGYETMHAIRLQAKQLGLQRFGITQDATEAPNNPAIDAGSNLTRTWIAADDYTSPVEWSVNDKELNILTYSGNGSAISIKDPIIAQSFKQLWKLLDKSLRQAPNYKDMPKKAGRNL
jgi:sugar-specific transcriptional regulator TrmB